MRAHDASQDGKRIHLCESEADGLAEGLNSLLNRVVEISRIMHGSRQIVDTLINEEALLFAKYLKGENDTWIPTVPSFRFQQSLSV